MSHKDVLTILEKRLGRRYARQRLGIEKDHEAQVFGQGINFFHIENLPVGHAVIRAFLMAAGLYWRGLRNAAKVEVRVNAIHARHLPEAFDGFTILQLSDLHVDMSEAAMTRVVQLVKDLGYDICILTGDYRSKTWGPYEPSLAGMEKENAERMQTAKAENDQLGADLSAAQKQVEDLEAENELTFSTSSKLRDWKSSWLSLPIWIFRP